MSIMTTIAADLMYAADRRGGRMPDLWRVGHGTYKALVKEMQEQAKIHQNGTLWVADNAFVDAESDIPPGAVMVLGVSVEEIRSYDDATPAQSWV